MALTVVQSKIGTATADTTLAIAFDTNPTAGNAIVVAFVSDTGTITSVTDSQSNSYTQYVTDVAPGTMRMECHYSTGITGGANTVTLTVGSSSDLIMAIYEISDMASSPEDVSAWAEDSGYNNTGSSGTTATTTQADELVLAFIAGSKDPTYTMAGYTFLEAIRGTSLSFCCGYKIVSSTGTQQASWTYYSDYQQMGSWICTFKEVVAAASLNIQINIGDAWKTVDAMQINIGDAWKSVSGEQINIGDVWKTID